MNPVDEYDAFVDAVQSGAPRPSALQEPVRLDQQLITY